MTISPENGSTSGLGPSQRGKARATRVGPILFGSWWMGGDSWVRSDRPAAFAARRDRVGSSDVHRSRVPRFQFLALYRSNDRSVRKIPHRTTIGNQNARIAQVLFDGSNLLVAWASRPCALSEKSVLPTGETPVPPIRQTETRRG